MWFLQKRNIKDLVEELLDELYADQRWNTQSGDYSRGYVKLLQKWHPWRLIA